MRAALRVVGKMEPDSAGAAPRLGPAEMGRVAENFRALRLRAGLQAESRRGPGSPAPDGAEAAT